MDKKIISIEKLLQTPVCMMSGEELAFLFNNLGVLDKDKKPESSMPSPEHKLAYGIKGIAETFGCSIPTANRIKKSGIIDKAISQLGREHKRQGLGNQKAMLIILSVCPDRLPWWPLETEAVEHLRGIAVGSFYPGKLYNGMCHLVDG